MSSRDSTGLPDVRPRVGVAVADAFVARDWVETSGDTGLLLRDIGRRELAALGVVLPLEMSSAAVSTGLSVDIASPRFLLAMKLFASRVETDTDDIALLLEDSYPGRPIEAKVQYMLQEIVDSLQ